VFNFVQNFSEIEQFTAELLMI